jgi:ankyrin repeat protein
MSIDTLEKIMVSTDTDSLARFEDALKSYRMSHPTAGYGPLLQAAIQKCDDRTVELLLKLGADPNYTSEGGVPVLLTAVDVARRNIHAKRYVKLLLENGAVPGGKSEELITAASWHKAEDRLEITGLLFRHGAVYNLSNAQPVSVAVADKDLDYLKLLLSHSEKDGVACGGPLIVCAAMSPQPKAVKLLLEGGEDVNAAADDGKTALTLAVESGRADTVKFLLSKGADATVVDKTGMSLLDYSKENTNITLMLLEAGAVPVGEQLYGPLAHAVSSNNIKHVKELAKYVDVWSDKHGGSDIWSIVASKVHEYDNAWRATAALLGLDPGRRKEILETLTTHGQGCLAKRLRRTMGAERGFPPIGVDEIMRAVKAKNPGGLQMDMTNVASITASEIQILVTDVRVCATHYMDTRCVISARDPHVEDLSVFLETYKEDKAATTFVRIPEKIMFVDMEHEKIWVKHLEKTIPERISCAMIKHISALRLKDVEDLLNSWSSSVDNFIWVGGTSTRPSVGFIDLVKPKRILGKRVRERDYRRSKRLTGTHATQYSLFGENPVMATALTAPVRARTFMSDFLAFPVYLPITALPEHIHVYRKESKYYDASELAESERCGTFYFRLPVTTIYLPIIGRKTVIYNDKSVAAIDLLFGGFARERNKGVRRFWPYAEKEILEQEKSMVPPSEDIVNYALQALGMGASSTVSDSWNGVLRYALANFFVVDTEEGAISSLTFDAIGRMVYIQPPDRTIFCYYSELHTMFTQRSASIPKSLEDDIFSHTDQTPRGNQLIVIHHPDTTIGPADMDNIKWISKRTEKSPIIISYPNFDQLVYAESNNVQAIQFLDDENLGKLAYTGTIAPLNITKQLEVFHVEKMDRKLCRMCRRMGIQTCIFTAAFHPDETFLTEIMDVRKRDDYRRLLQVSARKK